MQQQDDINKSTRHAKIIGNCGENIICNWLSRSGFEVAIVDHTGIDIIAYHPKSRIRLGISVKSRTRHSGTESESVNLYRNNDKDIDKLKNACEAFNCEPWLGIYVETAKCADVYLTSLMNFTNKYVNLAKVAQWNMTEKQKAIYAKDKDIKHVHIDFTCHNWKWE